MPGDDLSNRPYAVLFDVWLLYREMLAALDEVLQAAGLTSEHFAIYSALARSGPMRPGELAAFLRLTPTTVSTILRRLEQRGHVQLTPDAHDGRAKQVRLTRAGAAAHRKAMRLYLPFLERVESRIGDVAAARAVIARLRAAIGG